MYIIRCLDNSIVMHKHVCRYVDFLSHERSNLVAKVAQRERHNDEPNDARVVPVRSVCDAAMRENHTLKARISHKLATHVHVCCTNAHIRIIYGYVHTDKRMLQRN